jgi:hypothetical protein
MSEIETRNLRGAEVADVPIARVRRPKQLVTVGLATDLTDNCQAWTRAACSAIRPLYTSPSDLSGVKKFGIYT